MEVISLSDSDTGSSACKERNRSREKMSLISKKAQVERNEVISLSSNGSEKESMRSSATQRCRMTREKKRKSEEHKITFETPSPEKKVKQWMKNQQMFFIQKEMESNKGIPFSSEHLDSLTASVVKICTNKEPCSPTKSILIRQDYVNLNNIRSSPRTSSFESSTVVELNKCSESDSGCSTNNYSLKRNGNNSNDDDDTNKIKDCIKLKGTSNHFNENISIKFATLPNKKSVLLSNLCNSSGTQQKRRRGRLLKDKSKRTQQKRRRGRLLKDKSKRTQQKRRRDRPLKDKSKLMVQPMSPDSQKKDELCSYLQLMNTNGSKNHDLLQNRRSVRVINNQKLLERKEIEKKLNSVKLKKIMDPTKIPASSTEVNNDNSEKRDGVGDISERCSTRKSFAELNLQPSYITQNSPEKAKIDSGFLKPNVPARKESNFEDIMRVFLITETENENTSNGRNNSTELTNMKSSNESHSKETEETRKLLEALKKNNSPALNEKICDQLEQYLSKYNKSENCTEQTCNVTKNSKIRRSLRLIRNNISINKANRNNLNTRQKFLSKKQLNPHKDRVDYKIGSDRTLPKVINACKDLTLNRNNNNNSKVVMENGDNNGVNVPSLLKEKLKTQFELIQNLTPEHRKALFDSTKFARNNQICGMFIFPTKCNEIIKLHCDDLSCNGFKLSEKDVSEKASVTLAEILGVLEKQVDGSRREPELEIVEPSISNEQNGNEMRNETNMCISMSDYSLSEMEVRNYCLSAKEDDISKGQLNDLQVSNRTGSGSSTFSDVPHDQNTLFNIKTSTVMPPVLSYVTFPSNIQSQLLPMRTNSKEMIPSCATAAAASSSNSKPLNIYLNRKQRPKITIDSSLQTCGNNDDETDMSSNKIQNRLQTVQPVQVAKNKGQVEHAYYFDCTLVVVQELSVSFWKVCPLGNILGVHDMWEAKGDIHRLVSDDSTDQTVLETVMYMDKSVAYFEVWTKMNDAGALDIIVVIYFWLECFSQPSRKIVLLDSVKSKDADVTYLVLKRSRKILVATCATVGGLSTTFLSNHYLASDFQSIACTKQMGCVNYRVCTMHNIQECDTLIMGCGEQKITLWNVEYGFVVATIDLIGINENPLTLWTKCDRVNVPVYYFLSKAFGFLFVLQQFSDKSLKLIAINGINYTWKLLRSFEPNNTCGSLQGVCVENGLLVAFFDNTTLCWKIENREEILELPCDDSLKVFVSDSNVISVSNNHLQVKNALQYLLTCDDIYNTKV